MAIYIGIRKIEEDQDSKYYVFFDCNENEYGKISVNVHSGEVTVIEIADERAERFVLPRVKRAVAKQFENGKLPDEFCYAA